MDAVRLPVAGIGVLLRSPTGAEDVLLLEATTLDTRLALALLARVARRADDSPLDGGALSLTDVDVLLLRLRQRVVGDSLRAAARCPSSACGTPFDVAFRISDYLDHHRPRVPRGVEPHGEPGWFRLSRSGVVFRIPTAADQIAIAFEADPESALVRRCIRAADLTGRSRRPVEAAMEALAPSLLTDLQGRCPECGATVETPFDPLRYTLRELRDLAAFVHEDVHRIARSYHWSETEILALPAERRARYAELARMEGSALQ
jgi:hypothetical protein